MAQPFGIGDVVGGRYRITHHVVTSADQDIVFQGIDQVLNREVSILLASTQNAKQVATSAKELATGERSSEVQVLDLGLAEDRTYLISTQTHPNDLLDLVVPDSAPYVEPFFTDSLGSELFGQSRVMEPETFHDDAEYYAGLQGVAPGAEDQESEETGPQARRRRPAFLGKVSETLNRRLGTHRDADRLPQGPSGAPAAEPSDDVASFGSASASGAVYSGAAAAHSAGSPSLPRATDDSLADAAEPGQGETLTLQADMELVDPRPEADAEEEFGVAADTTGRLQPVGITVGPAAAPMGQPADQDHSHDDGEEVVNDPPDEPIAGYGTTSAAGSGSTDSELASGAAAAGQPSPTENPSFTGLISAVSSDRRSAFPGPVAGQEGDAPDAAEHVPAETPAAAPAADPAPAQERSGAGRWIGVAVLAAVVLVAAVFAFVALRGGDDSPPVAEDEETTEPEETTEAEGDDTGEDAEAPEDPEDADETPDEVTPEISSVSRLVPDSPGLNEDTDGQLPNTFDGDTTTTWSSFLFGSAEFGGLASEFALVVELEESSSVSAVTLTQEGEVEGGSFQVLVNDSPELEGAEEVGSGTWNWNETTVELDEQAEGQYLIINTTALPERLEPDNPDLPYGLQLAQITLE
ncbi:hypothetical protein [Nesterenkonia xinjiangensis]|uniref:hypothetical protein n=1 Tax=Nesterenkonia xinjiangensis TaxID=225327 RepID=UPI0031D117DE